MPAIPIIPIPSSPGTPSVLARARRRSRTTSRRAGPHRAGLRLRAAGALLALALIGAAIAAGPSPAIVLAWLGPVLLGFVAAWRRTGEERIDRARRWWARRRRSAHRTDELVRARPQTPVRVPALNVMGCGLACRPPPCPA